MSEKINIAIDGHSSCGKGTLAKNLAKELGYLFIDSGAMYRAVTLYILNEGLGLEEVEQDPAVLGNIKITFEFDPVRSYYETFLNGVNVENEIRSMRVSKFVSPVSTLKVVRDFLVTQQQNIGKDKGVVMDGRDIGTVVFPDAELKIFMTASAEIRAKRRYEELEKKGVHVNYQEVLHNIKERDHMDSTREESPLAKAEDAITLDNSSMTKDEQARLSLSWARGVIKSLASS
ncbi:MAG: (d)CMP kinase [Bacteroidetes bacterium]|nr:(d)CMP kinase [Bacteroidota bacterium]MDA8931033.1 (d)CMP kinase [Bacteroidia bacterium]